MSVNRIRVMKKGSSTYLTMKIQNVKNRNNKSALKGEIHKELDFQVKVEDRYETKGDIGERDLLRVCC